MIEELIYTSAPQGLKPGSSGFTTVASTAGMASNLANLLESLSGYRHLADPGTAGAKSNPVIYSHFKARVGGRNLSILSRIADAGLDYSGRTNKLAHHVVFSSIRLPKEGPASLQAQRGFHETSWSGEPRIIAEPRSVNAVSTEPTICKYWETVCGDAGWGGEIANRLRRAEGPEQWVIYPLSVDPLKLLQESMALLPDEDRWRVTYTTFYTKLPPGVDCRVRFAIDGTPEAQQLRRRYELQVLDLCGKLSTAPESPLAITARTGIIPEKPQLASMPSEEESSEVVLHPSNVLSDELPDLESGGPPPLPGKRLPKVGPKYSYSQSNDDGKGAWLLAGALMLLLLFASGGIGGYFAYKQGWFAKEDVATVAPPTNKKIVQNEKDSGPREKDAPAQHFKPLSSPKEPQTPAIPTLEDTVSLDPTDAPLQGNPASQQPNGGDANPDPGGENQNGSEGDTPAAEIAVEVLRDEQSAGQLAKSNGQENPQNNDAPQTGFDSEPERAFQANDFTIEKLLEEAPYSEELGITSFQKLKAKFWYPRSEDDTPGNRLHLSRRNDVWTLSNSNPEGQIGQGLLAIKQSGKGVLIELTPVAIKNLPKYERIIEKSELLFEMENEGSDASLHNTIRFSNPIPEKKLSPSLLYPNQDHSKLVSLMKNWKVDENDRRVWSEEWQLEDTHAGASYYLVVGDKALEVPIDRWINVDLKTKRFSYPYTELIGNHFAICLDIAVDRKERKSNSDILHIRFGWRLEPRSLQLIDPKFYELSEAIEGAYKRLKLINTPSLGVTTWDDLRQQLADGNVAKKLKLEPAKMKSLIDEFEQLDKLNIPLDFNPSEVEEKLKALKCEVELGVYLATANEDLSQDATENNEDRKLVLISTVRGKSKEK